MSIFSVNSKALSLLAAYLAAVLVLGYHGVSAITQSIRTQGVEHKISELSQSSTRLVAPVKIEELDINSYAVSAHDLNTYAKLNQWAWYIDRQSFQITSNAFLLTQSSYLRPTWAPTYIELYQQKRLVGDLNQASKYLNLAKKVGPNTTSVMMQSIDHVFSNWSNTTKDEKIDASTLLLKFAVHWKHREELNAMLKYSIGKQRMCSLLKFNQLNLDNCLSNLKVPE